MKEFYYHLRDERSRPVVTVCLLIEKNTMARGVAICSPKDNPKKKIGRAIAKGRALKGFTEGVTTHLVKRQEPMHVQKSVGLMIPFQFKSYGSDNPWFPDHEAELLKKVLPPAKKGGKAYEV